jgi:hypothetical protein
MLVASAPWPGCGNLILASMGAPHLLKTDTSARIVEELLIQIDEGMFV